MEQALVDNVGRARAEYTAAVEAYDEMAAAALHTRFRRARDAVFLKKAAEQETISFTRYIGAVKSLNEFRVFNKLPGP